MLHLHAPGIYNQKPAAQEAHHTNVVEKATHFWRSLAGWEALLGQLSYNGHGEVPKTHQWWTKVMNNISHMPKEEKGVISEKGGPDKSWVVCLEQKSVAWMKDLVRKFS